MVREFLNKVIREAVKNLYPDFGGAAGTLILGRTSNPEFGDYGVSLIPLASKTGKNPPAIAEEIREKLSASKEFKQFVSKSEFANGFLNFWLSEKGLEEGLKNLDKKFPAKKIKISLDYLDANPTGPVHLGHARSGFFGDCLSNILEFCGYKVSREFYVNNAKKNGQIQSLGKTALSIVEGGQGEEYKHEQLMKILGKTEVKKKLKKIKDEKETGLPAVASAKAGYYIAGLIQKENEKFLEKTAKIKFNLFFEEEKIYSSGLMEKILAKLKEKNAVYEKDGALWFRASEFGDSEDRVLIRSKGEPTYVLPDIAYHWDRLMKRKYDKAVNIFGADHFGYGPRLKGALQALGVDPERIKMIIYQMVRLVRAGKEVKMSKRAGEFVTLQELIDEVGLDPVRFFFLARSIDTHMNFDLDLAKKRSKKNPVYYVQYAHSRASSILRKAGASAKKINFSSEKSSFFSRNLILKLIQFPEVVEDIAKDYQVHRLTTYVYELAKIFTEFYENVPVLAAETRELKKSRLALVSASQKILEKTLGLMGISAPQKM